MKYYDYRQLICTSALALVLGLSGCKASTKDPVEPSTGVEESQTGTESQESKEESKTEIFLIKDPDAVSAGVSEKEPDLNIEAVEGISIKNTASTGDIKGLLRIPLPAAIMPDDLVSAKIRLKLQSGDSPQLRAAAVGNPWDRLGVTWDGIQDKLPGSTSVQAGKLVEEDWYELDITPIVHDWLSGKYGNNGILLEETQNDSSSVFYSPYSEHSEYCPELVIAYTPSAPKEYGTFHYENQEEGNCLSFALRDTDAILAENLNIDTKTLQQKYNTGGTDEALEYIKELVLAYVESHKDTLQISSFREIPSFDAPIDPATEYRIALRIGMETEKGLEDLPRGRASFDYHLQVQLFDGSWAEKFGASISRIVPGSNALVNPGLDAWDQNEIWGISKFSAYYDSNTVYFAVKKDSAGFTTHLH